jgi:regulator of replication initiation timing
MNAQKLPLVATWQGVINALLTDRYVSQKAEKAEAERARQKAENEVESFIGAFDEDNKNLRKQIEELTRVNTSLQMENQGLRAKLSGVEDVPILFLGVEEEFYQGEIKEMILDAVAENLKSVGQKTRRADVLNDVLQNNDYRRVSEERERVVKIMFKEYKTLLPSMRQQLQELGFEITEEGKHYRLTYYGDDRYKTTFSKTGSDWREGKNMASTIIKNMM